MHQKTKSGRKREIVKNKKKNQSPSPKRRGNSNDEIEKLTEEINEKWGDYSKLDSTALEYALSIGLMAIRLKYLLKKRRVGWTNYVKKNFPGLTIRTIQRYMKIRKLTCVRTYPVLEKMSQSVILTIIGKLEKGQNVASFLVENNIDLKIDIEDEEKIQEFSKKVADLIYVDDDDKKEEEEKGEGDKKKDYKKKKRKSKTTAKSFKTYMNSFITKIENAKKNQKLIKTISLKEFKRMEKEIRTQLSSLKELIEASQS